MVGQETRVGPEPASINTGVGLPGAFGSNVTSCTAPKKSTAVHGDVVGQETAPTASPGSIETGTGCWREPGANVTVWPAESTAVHWETEGQETPVVRGIPPRLRRIGPCHDRAVRAGPPASR